MGGKWKVLAFLMLILATSSQSPADPDKECLETINYKVETRKHGLILLSKHLKTGNCIQINTYEKKNLKFIFREDKNHRNKVVFNFDSEKEVNITTKNISMTIREMRSDLVYTEDYSRRSVIVLKTNLTEIVFAVPLTYDFFVIEKHKDEIAKMWLDTNVSTNDILTFTFLDHIMLILELVTIMIIVDIGLVFVLSFRRYNLIHEVHSKLMWLVLVFELLALCYFLWRYQFQFWSNWLFFYYFVASILINVFSIANTGVGVFLLTAIFERHISQNIPVLKSFHRYLGYISYGLMKLSLVVKYAIFVVFLEVTPGWIEIGICLTYPFIWLVFLLFRIIQFYYK